MNVPSYFLIVLGGFAIVWGFRWEKYKGHNGPTLGEFEYAAWSAIWGSAFIYLSLTLTRILFNWPSDATFTLLLQVPFIVTPIIVILGLVVGIVSAYIVESFKK